MQITNKTILAGSIGTLLEWAEFTFYGYLVYQFSQLFFPMISPEAAIIAAFGVFAVSYIARPIGSIVFGYIGDKVGRRKALSSSIILMGLATLSMGCLPTFNSIGIAAPILLILLRFLQGTAIAGEFTGAAVFILEQNKTRPFFSSSWIATSSAAGMLLGSLFGVIVSLPFMPQWAWRAPFILGAVGALVGFYIRLKLSETTEYQALIAQNKVEKTPLKTLFAQYKKPMLQTASIAAFIGAYIYTCNIWWVTHVIEKGYFSALEARTIAAIAQGFVVIFTPIIGWLSDGMNSKKFMNLGIAGCILTIPSIFIVSIQGSFYLSALASIFYSGFLALFTAPMFKYLKDLFPVNVRYTGQAVAWNIAVALFAGSAPMVAQIFSTYQMVYVAIAYVMLVGLAALLLNFNTNKNTP